MRSGDEVAGPRVQTIFARRVTPIRLVSPSGRTAGRPLADCGTIVQRRAVRAWPAGGTAPGTLWRRASATARRESYASTAADPAGAPDRGSAGVRRRRQGGHRGENVTGRSGAWPGATAPSWRRRPAGPGRSPPGRAGWGSRRAGRAGRAPPRCARPSPGARPARRPGAQTAITSASRWSARSAERGVGGVDPGGRAVEVVQGDRRERRADLAGGVDEHRHRAVGERGQPAGAQQVVVAVDHAAVEHPQQRPRTAAAPTWSTSGVPSAAEPVDHGCPAARSWPLYTRADEDQRLARRAGQEAGHHGQLVRGVGEQVAVAAQHATASVQGEHDHPGETAGSRCSR